MEQEYIIEDKTLQKLRQALDKPYCFESDECDCGNFSFKVDDNTYIEIYRSCKQSSATPDDMYWKIHEPILVKIGENNSVSNYHPTNFKLNKEQKDEIILLARLRTIKDIGYDEYKNNNTKWDELKEYLISEKNKVSNSDDIPQYILNDILKKMNELEEYKLYGRVKMDKVINEFIDEYFFLSNFFERPVTYKGITFQNNESAFQAMKCVNEYDMVNFANLTPDEGKYKGRHVRLRPDWEDVKDNFMYEIVKAKFEQNLDLQDKLIATGNTYLEEGNNWGDRIWGTVKGIGENRLGKILMRVRNELKEK